MSGIHYISVSGINRDYLADYDISIVENTTPAGTYDEIANYLTDGFWERRTFNVEPGGALTVYITDQQVDLRPEGISDVYGLVGNLTIARDTLIENFTDGSGNDHITGNEVANRLDGGEGDDELRGNGGDDMLEGGAGLDWASYEGSNAGVTVKLEDGMGEGGHAQGDVIADVENVRGSGYADLLVGDDSANHLDGAESDDELRGNGGDDVLEGGAGADQLEGGGGVDWLNGYIGDDEIWGGDGDDELTGNGGTNWLNGGAGADIFLFEFWLGDTTIADFTDNQDRIDLTYFELSGIDELVITSDTDGVTIDMSSIEGGGTILLEGFDIANLDAADFIF